MSALIEPYLTIVAFVLGPVLLGAVWARAGAPKSASKHLFSGAFYGTQTSLSLFTVWNARVHGRSALLPLLALSGWLVTAALALALSHALGHEPRRRGAFIAVMSQSNNGFTLLGFVALTLFGEQGLSQAAYAQLCYVPFFLLFCFPVARLFSGRKPQSLGRVILENARDPRVILPLGCLAVGLTLNLLGVPRPSFVSSLLKPLIYGGTLASGCAVGLLYRGARLDQYWRENALSFAYRSSIYPLLYGLLAIGFGLDRLDTRVLVLYGLVPSALLANLVAVFFDLDTDLTSSVFVVGTALFMLVVLPAYALLTAF